MSLATRCPVCSTVFRVVQDQLKVSEGWVRCGRCAKVFNAFEGLFDLERELAAMAPPQVSASQRVLEDLAQRNRQPRGKGEFTGDEFPDTGASVRVNSAPAADPAGRPWPRTPSGYGGLAAPNPAAPRPTARPVPSAEGSPPGLPSWAASRPAPLPDAQPAPRAQAWPAHVPAAAPATNTHTAGRPSAAWSPSRPAPLPSSPDKTVAPAATSPPVPPAPQPSVPAAQPAAAVAVEPVLPPAAPPVVQAKTASPAPPTLPGPDKVALKAEPVALPGAAQDAEPSDGSYESLFRSTGELDPATAHPSGVDIALDEDEARRHQADATDSQLLSFVQEADKAARWQRPGVRVALGLAAIVLSLTLVAQIALAERDLVAVRWPAIRPFLVAMCSVVNCRVEPLRRIERLAVESSGLTRIGEGQVYRLAMVLRNRGDLPLLLPAVDLSLTDSAGALVARRVLTAAELGAAAATIGAGQELPLQVMLRSAERPVTGYTIEIFYP